MALLGYVIVQSPLARDFLTDSVLVSYGSVSPCMSSYYLVAQHQRRGYNGADLFLPIAHFSIPLSSVLVC